MYLTQCWMYIYLSSLKRVIFESLFFIIKKKNKIIRKNSIHYVENTKVEVQFNLLDPFTCHVTTILTSQLFYLQFMLYYDLLDEHRFSLPNRLFKI